MSNLRFVMSNRFEVFDDRLWIPQIAFWILYRFPASQIGYSIFDPVQLDIENRFDLEHFMFRFPRKIGFSKNILGIGKNRKARILGFPILGFPKGELGLGELGLDLGF